MVESGKVRRNFSISNRASEAIDQMAEKYDMPYSDVVENAVLEYSDRDRLARIEDKLDRVLDESETPSPPSEQNQSKKEKRSSPVDRRADEMFDYILDTYDELPVITSHEIEVAIEEVWGDTSEHMVSKYSPLIEKRLQDAGWHPHPIKDSWYRNEEDLKEGIALTYKDASTLVEELSENPLYADHSEVDLKFAPVAENPSDFKNAVLSQELAEESEVKEVVAMAQNHYERIRDNVSR